MKKKFMFNFILSFLSYVVIDIMEILIFNLFAPSTGLLWKYIRNIFYDHFLGKIGGFIFFCIEVLISVFLPIIIYIIIGSRLKQLGK